MSVTRNIFNKSLVKKMKSSVDAQFPDQQVGLSKDQPYNNRIVTVNQCSTTYE